MKGKDEVVLHLHSRCHLGGRSRGRGVPTSPRGGLSCRVLGVRTRRRSHKSPLCNRFYRSTSYIVETSASLSAVALHLPGGPHPQAAYTILLTDIKAYADIALLLPFMFHQQRPSKRLPVRDHGSRKSRSRATTNKHVQYVRTYVFMLTYRLLIDSI